MVAESIQDQNECMLHIQRKLAHDLNNLLAGILGMASLLRRGAALDSQDMQRVQNIQRAAQRAIDLVQQLQDASDKSVV